MGLTAELICRVLELMSKVPVHENVVKFVRMNTVGYGKVKLVLEHGRRYLESAYPAVLRLLAAHPTIAKARVYRDDDDLDDVTAEGFSVSAAREEHEASLGLAGFMPGAGPARAAGSRPGRAAQAAVDTAQGLLSGRVLGEVDEPDIPGMAQDHARFVVPADAFVGPGRAAATWTPYAVPAKRPAEDVKPTERQGDFNIDELIGEAPGTEEWRTVVTDPTELQQMAQLQRAAAEEAANPMTDMSAARVLRFEISVEATNTVKAACLGFHPAYPVLHEYDFKSDASVPNLPIRLRKPEALRPYQSKSLAKMFGNGRARSGIIVLPCGAGKTLVGISAACTMKKSCIIFCPNTNSVEQWVGQLQTFSTVDNRAIIKLTAKSKAQLPPADTACVVLTTYSMVTAGGERATETRQILDAIRTREWGIMLLDEVHQVAARTFEKVLNLQAHCRLGLTATLVREDGKDANLSYTVGPKLYEANWMDLTRAGYLANVQVCEVWCPMVREFYLEYLGAKSGFRKQALAVLNPVKCWVLHKLLRKHQSRPGDKIIVFCDSVVVLQAYAQAFGVPVVHGSVKQSERAHIIRAFRTNPEVNTLFLSRVGDVALDVPDANVLIQLSAMGGSRLQEAQRLGRILRKGKQQTGGPGFNAYFYNLVSTDTREEYDAARRRRYLADQGYAYKVLEAVPDVAASRSALAAGCPIMETPAKYMEQLYSLRVNAAVEDEQKKENAAVKAEGEAGDAVSGLGTSALGMNANAVRAEYKAAQAAGLAVQAAHADSDSDSDAEGAGSGAVITRRVGSLAGMSGGTGVRYVEFDSSVRTQALAEAEAAAARAAAAAARSLGSATVQPKPASQVPDTSVLDRVM